MEKRYRICIVDDDQLYLKVLEATFATTDFEIVSTDNPVTALEMIKQNHFHVVVSDIEMPEMTGLELLRKIKEYNAFIQVIIITGKITINNALNAFRYGASDCFFKPFKDPNEVIDAVNNCIIKIERINSFLKKLASAGRGRDTTLA